MNRRDLLDFNNRVSEEKFGIRKAPANQTGSSTLAEPIDMPNEGAVWVHPLSLEEDAWAVAQAGKEVRDLKLSDANEAEWYIRTRTSVYETIAACRVGPEPDSPRVYTKDDAKRLRTDPAYRAKIGRVVEISNRLGSDEFTKDALTGFFGEILDPLERCSLLPNNEDYWTCSQEILTDLVLRLRLTRQRRTLSLAASEEVRPREGQDEKTEPTDSGFDGLELPPERVGPSPFARVSPEFREPHPHA